MKWFLVNRISSFALAAVAFLIFAGYASAEDQVMTVPSTNVAQWSFLVGVFLPMAIAFVTQAHWSAMAKGIATFVVSLIAAIGTAYFAGQLNRGDIVSSLLIILVMATLTYQTFYRPSGVAPKIEAATTITSPKTP